MSAKDYKICCGLASAYIARKTKRFQFTISADRSEIDEQVILGLIDWYVTARVKTGFSINSQLKPGYDINISIRKS